MAIFENKYPLFVFDISRQVERLKDTGSDFQIKADFNTNITENEIS